jgi:periplasmic divalent cation tolerance protein
MTGCCQVTTTVGTESDAAGLASALVHERLAACVQVIGPLRSTYRWRGAVETSTEWMCIVKTAEARLPALCARIRNLHAYEQPEILATVIAAGDAGYLEWVKRETSPDPERS